MMDQRSIRCGQCGFQLPCRSWGFFYVADDDGNRILLEGDLESTIRCRSCGSDDVATFIGLIGTACPKCGTGTLEERAASAGEGGEW